MPLIGWIATMAAAVLAGAGLGWWIVNNILVRQFKNRLHKATEQLKQQHAATDDKLRSAHTRAMLEIEQIKASIPRQIAAATTDSRAKIARLEEQLKHAHGELDRLRPKAKSSGSRGELTDGFAATMPFGDSQ